MRALADGVSPENQASLPDECEALKQELARIVSASPALQKALDRVIAILNGTPGSPESFNALHRLLEAQAYRLSYWRVASSDINYRRFFDINTLAGIRVEIPEIFDKTHELIVRLVEEGHVHGLRIDHIDGLADPEGYTRALQRKVGPGFYVAVEKILEPGETLRSWPVAGTSGYDVLNVIDGVLVDSTAGEAFERIYRKASSLRGSYDTLLEQAKLEIVENNFASELEVLVSDIKAIADASRRTRDYTIFALRRALIEIIAAFPVYRSYIRDGEPAAEDVRLIEETIAASSGEQHPPRPQRARFRCSCPVGADRSRRSGRCPPLPPALPATDRSRHGEEPRGHPVLSLWPFDRAQRSRRRPRPFRALARGFSCGQR